MSHAGKLLRELIAEGRLLLPDASAPSFVDLVRALAHLAGASDMPVAPFGRQIVERIGDHDHIVLALVDGRGMNLLSLLPDDSFLRRHFDMEMRAIFPSTTACAMTTLATGLWPCEHGVPGWWAYLDEHELSVTTLPFVGRYTQMALRLHGVSADDLWPLKPLAGRMGRDFVAIQPIAFWNSTFSQYLRGGGGGKGFAKISGPMGAIDMTVRHIAGRAEPSYTFLYLDELDAVCHVHGIESDEAHAFLVLIDQELERLAGELDGRARLVITADHGHINVPAGRRHAIFDDDPMMKLIRCPPSGEPRVPQFHVAAGCEQAFAGMFEERFGRDFALVSQQQASEMGLYGPGEMSAGAARRFGDFAAVPLDHVILRHYGRGADPANDLLGRHAGLDRDEMRIPLILV